ncbi:MAG: Aspartyl-tRNA(Asn) amidotransferase subunit C @ Glutamyl-tRNA(Gln) amidotransferase subunit C, partial [uncultured Acetobacteraceae bacterium]
VPRRRHGEAGRLARPHPDGAGGACPHGSGTERHPRLGRATASGADRRGGAHGGRRGGVAAPPRGRGGGRREGRGGARQRAGPRRRLFRCSEGGGM